MRFGETTTMKFALGLMAACTLAITTVACTDDGMGTDDAASTEAGTTAAESTGAETTAADSTGGGGSDAQTPPMSGYTDIEAWLADGHYLEWTCEPAAHAATIGVSPHGMQLICSNDLMAGAGAGEYPVGSAAVKELYMDDGTMYGHAVSLHFQAGTEGDSWYWYEKVFADHPAPHDANGVVADGVGSSGPAQTICVSCHSAAGLDADHPGHDFVYVQVQ
jgi:hypothetical protein